jgi:hypothetical protein
MIYTTFRKLLKPFSGMGPGKRQEKQLFLKRSIDIDEQGAISTPGSLLSEQEKLDGHVDKAPRGKDFLQGTSERSHRRPEYMR